MKQTFLVTIETLKTVTAMELEQLIFEELHLLYYHPDVDVVEIGKPDPKLDDEESKTVFRNARQSGKSLTMAGLK